MSINLIKTILAFQSETDLKKFKFNFKNYLTESTLLCLFNDSSTLGGMDFTNYVACSKMANNHDVIIFERKNGYRFQNYSKNFVVSDNDYTVEIYEGRSLDVTRGDLVPLEFAKDHDIEIKNSLDYTVYNRDTEFSNSCGYYDSEFFTVFHGDLVSREDLITLDSGEVVYYDDAFCCPECDSWVRDDDTIYNEHVECYVCDSCNERINE